jgi:4-amino-4-deoxy-L-arabinose transferase-like glycosyltransferase
MKKIIISSILLISLIIQIMFVLTVNTVPESDMKGYDERGLLFAEEQKFSYGGTYNGSTYRPPMYILFLAAIYKVFGHNYHAVYIVQSFMSVACLGLIYLLARRLWNGTVGMISLVLSALYVPFIGYSGILLSEILFLFFLLAFSYFALRAVQTRSISFTVLSAVFCALATMTRSISLLLPVGIVIMLVICYRKQMLTKTALTRVSLFFAAMLLTISPWTIRNYVDTGEFVLIDSISGLNLLIGNNEYADGFFTFKVWETEGWIAAHQPQYNLPQADNVMRDYAVQWIIDNPMRFAELTYQRALSYFTVNTDWFTPSYGWNNILYNKLNFESHYHTFLFVSFFLGLLLIRRKKPELVFLSITVLYFIGLSSLFYMSPRYRLPAMPFILIYCAYTLYWLGLVLKTKWTFIRKQKNLSENRIS